MDPVGYALVGCGAFGRFCLESHGENRALTRIAVTDLDPALARLTEEESGVPARTLDMVLADDRVELVHLATPPFTHRELGERILRAGKHLLCEKPLATSAEDADALLATAREVNRRVTVNLIMRYSPIVEIVRAILDTGILGAPIRASLENDAQDEHLPAAHWFWDRARSGGILVEHAVHFFDLFEHWYGPGEAVTAAVSVREDGREDRVHAVVRHGRTLVTQTHAFTQTKPADRQRWRLVHARGEITMEEWIPVRLRLEGRFTERERSVLDGLLSRVSEGDAIETRNYDERRPEVRYARWAHHLTDKETVYRAAVRDLAADLARAIRDPDHRPRIDETNARRSLELALACRDAA